MGISHSCRAFLHKNGQVMIRVRWNNRKCEVGFSVGCNADLEKWDNENQRVDTTLLIKLVERYMLPVILIIAFLNFWNVLKNLSQSMVYIPKSLPQKSWLMRSWGE